MNRFAAIVVGSISLLTMAGCALLNQQMAQQIQYYQARQVAHSRLFVLAVVCLIALPLCVMAGLVWGKRTVSLKIWMLLLTTECILLALFAALRAYFY